MTMNKLTQRFLATSVAVLLAGVSVSAMARGPGGCNGTQDSARAEKMQQHKTDKMAKHQADLKAALKLTAAQEPAWAAFTGTMKAPAATAKNCTSHEEMAKLTTPQRMEKMQAMKGVHDAQMTQRMEATKTFYAALTPEQQKVFDEKSHGKGGHSGGRGHGERGMNHS
jgi:Spy/CpxP family protein refolding chaperone